MKLPGVPTADDVAWALVKAARYYGDLGALARAPAACLRGQKPLHSRWLALAALERVWDPGDGWRFTRRWGFRVSPIPWPDLVAEIAADLIDAHEGG